MKQADDRQGAKLHRPNAAAYATMALLTAAPIGLYVLGMSLWGPARVYTVFLSKGIWPPIALGVLYIGIWLYTADELLRSYHFDEVGLTIYRPFMSEQRINWTDIRYMRREYDRIILDLSDGGRITLAIDYVTESSDLSGAIVDKTHHL